MYGCLSKPVNVTDNRKDTSILQNMSVMFYSTAPIASTTDL